jgi:hypothetical protein
MAFQAENRDCGETRAAHFLDAQYRENHVGAKKVRQFFLSSLCYSMYRSEPLGFRITGEASPFTMIHS